MTSANCPVQNALKWTRTQKQPNTKRPLIFNKRYRCHIRVSVTKNTSISHNTSAWKTTNYLSGGRNDSATQMTSKRPQDLNRNKYLTLWNITADSDTITGRRKSMRTTLTPCSCSHNPTFTSRHTLTAGESHPCDAEATIFVNCCVNEVTQSASRCL